MTAALEAVLGAMFRITRWVVTTAPLAVFAISAWLAATQGVAALVALAKLAGTPYLGYGRRAAAHAFRGDADDSCWALDRSSPEMWRELEQAVREREQAARKHRQPEQPMQPTVPDLPEITPETPTRKKTRVGTTEKGKGANKRDDDWWD